MLSETFHEAEIRGLKTAWLEVGVRGRPVVFLCHGFPDDPSAWTQQIRSLTPYYHVIAPYVRGCDRSEAAEDLRRYGTKSILLDHLEILKRANVAVETPITVMGHDLGAAHAIELARVLGRRLMAVVVINGTDVGSFARRLSQSSKQRGKSWYMGLMQLPIIPEVLVKMAPESCSWLAGELGGLPKELRETAGFERRTLAPLNQYRAFAREVPKQVKDRPARIKSPLLVIWGRDDGLLAAPSRAEWERLALHVTIRIMVGGHWVHREDPETINTVLLDFLETAKRQYDAEADSSKRQDADLSPGIGSQV